MKLALILFACIMAVVSADHERAPEFIVRNGRLVRSDGRDLPFPGNSKNPLSRLVTSDPRFGYANERVVGGAPADPNSAPWIVSLQWGIVRPAHFCAGSVIAPNWVLTAGHCTMAYPNNGISTVVSGMHNLNFFSGTEQIRQVNLAQTWVHEDFSGNVGPHDVSLILVQQPFVFDWTVSAIALPDADEIHSGNAVLHGWGSTSDTFFPVFPNILHTVQKPIIPIATCFAQFGQTPVHENNVCTGPLTGGISACSGDSGGPLTQNNELVGIVSWGFIPCGQPNAPSFYVRVSAYIDWINNIINSN